MSLQFNNQKPDNEQVTHYPKATSTPANKTVGVEGFTPKAQTVQKTNGGYNVADSNGLSFKSTTGKSVKEGSYSIGEMCGIIYDSFSKGNKNEANKAFNALVSLQRDPNSKYYNAYAGVTNTAVLDNLSKLTGRDYSNGISTQEINDLWNQFGSQYVATNTGGISSSTKNSAGAQIAYYVNQLAQGEKTTQAAEGELAKKMAEVQYYVDRGYSDDWIRKNVNFDDCSTIKKAVENANTAGMLPTQFNRSIGIYGEDTINGMLYSARRGNGTYSGMSDIMMYYGAGSGYKADKNSEAARDKTNPEAYHPYSFGASDTKNMNTICRNYGIAAFDRGWLDANEASLIENGDYAHALAAVENYEAATKELELLDKYSDVRIASAIEKGENITPEQVMAVAFDANPKDFPTLVKMDDKRKKGEALEVSDSVDFTRTYYLQKIEQKIEDAQRAKQKADDDALLTSLGIDPTSAGKKPNEIDEATAKANIVGSTAYSLIASSMDSDNDMQEDYKPTSAEILKYIEEKGLERKEGMTDEEYLEMLNTHANDSYSSAQTRATEKKREEALQVQPTQNFSMSEFYETERDENDSIDETGYIEDAIVLGLQGKEDMITDPNGKAWWMKYSGTLTAGTERDTTSYVSALSGRALTHDRLTETFGDNVASKLYAVDDAARDGYISMNERAGYLMQMSALVDKYGEKGIEAVYNGQAGTEEEQAQVRGVVDGLDNTIVQNREQIEAKAHAGKQTNAAYYGLLLQDENEANTETGRAMLEALESINLSDVDDDDYDDALTNLNNYVNDYLLNEHEDMLVGDGSTNGINAPIYYAAALDINNIMRVAVATDLGFDEALVSMGYDSIDALIADSTDRVFKAYQTTYDDLAGVVDAFIGSFSDKEIYATVDTGTSPEKWNARWQDMLTQIAEDEVVSEEQLARFEEFYNSLDGSEQRALREEMLDRQRGSEDNSQFNTYLARMANESAEKAYNNSIGNVDVASTAKGIEGDAEGGFFDALGRGVSAGYVQHKMGIGDIVKAAMARDTATLEAEYRSNYTRPEVLEQYQNAINKIEDPGYRQLMQQQLDSYTGDAYDFKFDINTVAIENYRRRQEAKLQLMNKEALEALTPAEYNVYSSMQTVTNSALVSLETVGTIALMTAAGMPESSAVMLANIAVTGSFEGAPITLDLIEKGVSSDSAKLFGAMGGATSGLIEGYFDTGIKYFGYKTGFTRYIDGALGVDVGASTNYWASGLMNKMLRKGVNKNVAAFTASAAKFGGDFLLNNLVNMAESAVSESFQEGAQELSSQTVTGLALAANGKGNFFDSFDFDPIMDVAWETFKNTPYQSTFGGMFGSIGGNVIRGAANNTVGRVTGNYQQTSFKQTLDAMRSVGDWEADFMRAMEADAEARTMYQQNREATNAEVNAEAQAQIDAENAQAQYESEVLDDAYAEWLDTMFANYRIQYESADLGLNDIQIINEGEIGQAVRDAEAAETEAKQNLAQAEESVQNTEKIMNDAEQEMMSQDIPSADSIKLYKESQTAFSAALDALAQAQDNLAQRTAEVKAAVANRTKMFSAAMENARQVAKANVEKTIADIKAAREQLRQKNIQAIKEAAQREIETRDERIGTMNVAETETNLRSKFSENSGAQWFIDMAKMLAENTGKNIFDNYVERETKAKLAIADIIQTSFPGWTVKVEQLEGRTANIVKTERTITFNSDATIQQWFTGIIAHELVHMAEGTGKYTDFKKALIKEFYNDSESDTYKEAVEYIKENYLVEDLKGLTDEQAKRLIEDELVTYTTERLFNQGEFINGDADTFKVFTEMLLKSGQVEFGRDIYNILLNQAVAIKQVNAKNGWFKTQLKAEQVRYAQLVESLADMIKSVSDDTKAKALETPKSAAEVLFDQTDNEVTEPANAADADSYKNAVDKGEAVKFDESIKPNLPAFSVDEKGEYSLSDEAVENLDADEKAIVEAAIETHTEDEYNAALAGDVENVAQTVEDDVRRETLNAIRDGILGDGLTEDDLANIQTMVDDGLILQSDIDLIRKWADGNVAAIPTRAPKVEAPKTDYDLFERTNLTDENGKKIPLGSKKISPYYNTHWDEFLYAREAAEVLLDDMADYAAPESYAFEGGVGENYTEVRRVNGISTSLISDLLSHFSSGKGKGRSADQVRSALAEFIKAYDTSTPLRNTAAMKWIELAVDDILRNGYKTIRGEEYSANQDYINIQQPQDANIRYSSSFGNIRSRLGNIFTNMYNSLAREAIESGDATTYRRMMGRMYGSLARYKTNSNTKVGTPLNTVRMLANDLGSHIFEGVKQGQIKGSVDMVEAGSPLLANPLVQRAYDAWSNAISTDAVSGKNLSALMGSIAESVMKRLNEAGLINNTDQQTAEDFAEWFFHFMTHGDANLGNAASMYAQTFREAVNNSNDDNLKAMWNAVLNRRQQLCKYIYANNAQKAMTYMVSKSNKVKNPNNNWRDSIKSFLTTIADKSLVATVVDEQTGGHALQNAVLYSPYMLRRAEAVLDGKYFADLDGHRLGFDTLSEVAEKSGLEPGKQNYKDAGLYLMCKTALDRVAQGMPAFADATESNQMVDSNDAWSAVPTTEQMQEVVSEFEANRPDIVKFAEGFWEFGRNVMDTFVVKEGLLDNDIWEEWKAKNPHYASLKRYMGDLTKSASTARNTALGLTFERYQGNSSREVINPIESMVDMVHNIVNAATQNRIKQVFSEQYESNPNLGYIADRVDADTVNLHDPDVIAVHFHNDITNANEERYYKITNRELYELLTGSGNINQVSKGIETLGRITRGMTMLTTGVNVLFSVKNAMRDIQHSVNYGSWASNYVTGIYKWFKAANDIRKEMFGGKGSEQAKDYISLGGGEWERLNTRGGKSVNEMRKEIMGRTATERVGHTIYNTITVSNFNALIETASRYAEYKYGKNDTSATATDASKKAAFMAAQEATVDFQRSGTGLRALRKCVPFFNATIQGNYQDFRMLTNVFAKGEDGKKARKAFVKTAMNNIISGVLAAVINLFGASDDDKEEYLNVEEGMKSDYIFVPARLITEKLHGEKVANTVWGGRDVFRIPIAAGSVEHMFFNYGRKAMEDLYQGKEIDGIAADLISITGHSFIEGFSEMTTIVSPLNDVSSNTAWYGGQLVSDTLMDRYPADRTMWTNPTDSMVSKRLAKALAALNDTMLGDVLINDNWTSPIAIDYIAQQYTGVIGQLVLPLLKTNKYTGESLFNPNDVTGNGIADTSIYVAKNLLQSVRKAYTIDTDASSSIDAVYETLYDRATTFMNAGKTEGSIPMFVKPGLNDEELTTGSETAKTMLSKGGILYEAEEKISNEWKRFSTIMNGGTWEVKDDDGNVIDTISYSGYSEGDRQRLAEDCYTEIRRIQEGVVQAAGEFEEKYFTDHKIASVFSAADKTVTPWTPTEREINKLNTTAQADYDNDERYMVYAAQLYDSKPSDTVMPSPAYEWTSNKAKYKISDAYKEQYDEDFMLRYKELAEQYLVKYDAGAFADEEEAREEWAKVRTGANEYARKMWNLNGNP